MPEPAGIDAAVAVYAERYAHEMSDKPIPHRAAAPFLGAAFLMTATVAYLGMRWNMAETRLAFPAGTKAMLIAAAVVSALARILGKTPPRATIVVVGGAVPVGAFSAIMIGMLRDPTSQNLWPIGLVLLSVLAVALSSLGTGVGSLVLHLVHSPHADNGA